MSFINRPQCNDIILLQSIFNEKGPKNLKLFNLNVARQIQVVQQNSVNYKEIQIATVENVTQIILGSHKEDHHYNTHHKTSN